MCLCIELFLNLTRRSRIWRADILVNVEKHVQGDHSVQSVHYVQSVQSTVYRVFR